MKITISYTSEEEREATFIKDFLNGFCDGVKVRESDRHAPFKHIYLTTKKAEIHCGSKENT